MGEFGSKWIQKLKIGRKRRQNWLGLSGLKSFVTEGEEGRKRGMHAFHFIRFLQSRRIRLDNESYTLDIQPLESLPLALE